MSVRQATFTGLSVDDLKRLRARQRAAVTDAKGGLKVLRAGLDALDKADKATARKPRKTKKTTLKGKKPETLEG